MGILFVALMTSLGAAPVQAPITVTVRTVGADAAPVPGINVTVRPVDDCGRRRATGASIDGITRAEGDVSFRLESYKSYLLRTDREGGFEAREMCLPIRSSADLTRYVQFQLRLDPRNAVTIEHPSRGPARPGSRRLVLGSPSKARMGTR
jgi:hypothetical protein